MTPLVLAVLLALADPGAAQTAAGQAPPAKTPAKASKKDLDKMVCRSEEQVGSNIRVRTCMTRSQWELQEQQVRQYFDDAHDRGGISSGQGNPMAPK